MVSIMGIARLRWQSVAIMTMIVVSSCGLRNPTQAPTTESPVPIEPTLLLPQALLK